MTEKQCAIVVLGGGGRLFMDTLRDKSAQFGVELLTRHRALRPETENGRITAVIVQGPDGDIRIRCETCILATGSWINDPEIAAQICPEFWESRPQMDASPHMNPNYTGDGFAFARAVDAMQDRSNYCLRMMGPLVFSKSGVIAHMGGSPYAILVDGSGKRYMCEASEPRIGPFNSGMVMMEKTRGVSYVIFDTANLEAAVAQNALNPQPDPNAAFGNAPLPLDMAGAYADIETALEKESKRFFRTGTPEALASLIQIDPQALRDSIERYNQSCRERFDRDCFKDPQYMIPLAKPPYYAIRAKLGTDGAFGGINVNANMQALRADGSVIDGLYVTGDFASGRFINMTGVKVQLINDMSWALASGFIAGTQAAGTD